MTPTRRIALNILATYGRSLFAMGCGLFSSRWILMVLGESDYGLYALVGGLTGLIVFVNSTLASAVSRFFAYSIGQSHVEQDIEGCRKWFNTAVLIHWVVPVALLVIGYPLGEWAVRRYLVIPPDRIDTCLWIFRVSCLSCFVGMVNVPFSAMFTAKQYIAEITIYSLITTIANVSILGYMVLNPGDWLLVYAVLTCVVSVIPQLLICCRAIRVFPECHFRLSYMLDFSRVKEIFGFATWQIVGNLCYMIRCQGFSILVNRFFGPQYNATMGVSATITSQTGQLAAAMNGAFTPVVSAKAGSGDRDGMLDMAYRSCKYGMILTLLFVVPLALECDYIIPLWLKNLPPEVIPAAIFSLVAMGINSGSRGMVLAVTADGRIARFTIGLGLLDVVAVVSAAISVGCLDMPFLTVMVVLVAYNVLWNLLAVFFAHESVGFSYKRWFNDCVWPMGKVAFPTVLVGLGIKSLLPMGVVRSSLVIGAVLISYVALVVLLALTEEERQFFRDRVVRKFFVTQERGRKGQ